MDGTIRPFRPPIRTENQLLERLIAGAMQDYLAGNYAGAIERLRDAQAIENGRMDFAPFAAFLAVLASFVEHGELPARLVEWLPRSGVYA